MVDAIWKQVMSASGRLSKLVTPLCGLAPLSLHEKPSGHWNVPPRPPGLQYRFSSYEMPASLKQRKLHKAEEGEKGVRALEREEAREGRRGLFGD